MRFADEVVGQDQIDDLPAGRPKPDARELRLATTIVDSLAADWEPERYHDTYTEELKGLIERKAAGETITVEETPETGGEVIDLMAALEASVKAAKQARGAGGTRRAADLQRRIERAADDLRGDDGDEPGTGGPGSTGGGAGTKSASPKTASAKKTSVKATSQKAASSRKSSGKRGSTKTTSAKAASAKTASAKTASTKKAAGKRAAAKPASSRSAAAGKGDRHGARKSA
jgi:DNA end-binding protein Ku